MSAETNKAVVRAIAEQVINTGALDRADDYFVADYIEHVPLPPGFPTGLAALKTYWAMMRAAFPDLNLTVEDLLAEGDRVVLRATAQGTHQGELMGLPPTGRTASWSEIHICRLAGGQVVEHWGNVDQLGLLTQLGAIPAPAAA
jgi:predicted ester cyclase